MSRHLGRRGSTRRRRGSGGARAPSRGNGRRATVPPDGRRIARPAARRAGRRPGRGAPGRARAARRSGAAPVRRVLLAEDQDPSPQLDRIEELAARMRVPVETVPRGRLDAQARTEPPRACWPWPARSSRSRSRTCCAPGRGGGARSCWWRPASPIRATSARCCAAPSAPGSPASCCRATARPGCRRRWPRRRPGRSSTCPSPSVGGVPAALERLRELGVWSVGLAGEAVAVALRPAARRRAGGAGGGQRGEGAGPTGPAALRRRGRHPPARRPAVAQRRGGRRGRMLRGGAPAGRGRWRGFGFGLGARAASPPRPCRRHSGAPRRGCRSGTRGTGRFSGSASSLGMRLRRRMSAVSGTTTAKNTTVATMTKATT